MLPDLILTITFLVLWITSLILFSIGALAGLEIIDSIIPKNIPFNWSDEANNMNAAKEIAGVVLFGFWTFIAIGTSKLHYNCIQLCG